MITWKPDPQTYDQALHEIGCLEAQVAELQEQLTEAHRQIAALAEAKAADMTHNVFYPDPATPEDNPQPRPLRPA